MKKKHLILPVLLTAASAFLTLPASAKLEADPQYGDVIVMYSEDRTTDSVNRGDPLCKLINERRETAGVPAVMLNDELTEQAARRVAQLADGSGRADAGTLGVTDASETVIRGQADINTMICSILLSEQQMKNLLYAGYGQFGYACNEENTVWVLLMTS